MDEDLANVIVNLVLGGVKLQHDLTVVELTAAIFIEELLGLVTVLSCNILEVVLVLGVLLTAADVHARNRTQHDWEHNEGDDDEDV